MDNNHISYILLMAVGVFIGSLSQILLKKSANKVYKNQFFEFINPLVAISYFIFILTTIISVISLRVLPLSYGAVIEATSYFYITLWGAIFFKEKIKINKIIGLVLIISGTILYII